jgi:hypothetical protein
LISHGFYYILELGMCHQKCIGIILLLAVLALFGGCGALDAILPSTGTYKINAMVNETPLDDFSIVTSKDTVLPFFEEPVSDDPDITELVVFLKDSRGQAAGYKVTYSLIVTDKDNNKENNKEDVKELQQDSKTENKDDKKKDEVASNSGADKTDKSKDTVKEDASADKKKDDVSANSGADKTDKSKDAVKEEVSTDKKKDEVVTGAVTDKTDKSKDTVKEDASADKKKDEVVTNAGADKTNKDKDEAAAVIKDPLKLFEHTRNGNEINFPVKSLDKTLPFLPIPPDLPIGKYTLVFQVKGKNSLLYKFEKPLFYLADAEFSFEGIQVHLPGIAESLQFIQNKNIILLDVNLDFDSRLEPYIVWYNGKKIIYEGLYSDGAGTMFWKAPEQNGFVSIRAEVFPSWERTGLTGYQKGISLLVSSKEVDMHLLSKDATNLVQWYVFEDDLTDSLTKDSEEQAIEPAAKNKPGWLPSNGTYGLVAGADNAFKVPVVPLTKKENESENWQIVSRFKPLSEGEIFSVQFDSADTVMTLSGKKSNLVLSLASASKTDTESLKLPDEGDSFIAVSVKIIIQNGQLSAKLAFVRPNEDFNNQKEPVINPISVAAEPEKDLKIILGQQQKKSADNTQTADVKESSVKEPSVKELPVKEPQVKESSVKETPAKEPSASGQSLTALWDELAILRLPAVEIIKTKKDTKEARVEETAAVETELPEAAAANIPDDESTLPE